MSLLKGLYLVMGSEVEILVNLSGTIEDKEPILESEQGTIYFYFIIKENLEVLTKKLEDFQPQCFLILFLLL